MKKYTLTINDKIIGYYESLESAWRNYYRYARENQKLGPHRMRVDPYEPIDMREDVFGVCKTRMDILESLLFFATDYKEADIPVCPHILTKKINEAIDLAVKLPC